MIYYIDITQQFNHKYHQKELKQPWNQKIPNSSNTIRNLINNKNNNTHIKSMAKVYDIPCWDCKKTYVGENSHNLKKQIYEYIKDSKKVNMYNGLVKHNLQTNHNFKLEDSRMLHN